MSDDDKTFQQKAAELAEAHLSTLDDIAKNGETETARVAAVKLLAELGGQQVDTGAKDRGYGIVFIVSDAEREQIDNMADADILKLATGGD